MTQALPDPLVAAEIDLRGYEFMPLYGDRLKKSETWVMANPEGKVAALALWWHAYGHECPAGTLPDNDTLLADYAGYGVAVKAWLKIKPQAMRGWMKCSDGRMHHVFVAQLVTEAWEFKKAQRDRTEKARLARLSQKQSQNGKSPVTQSVTGSVTASTGQDSTGQDSTLNSKAAAARMPAVPSEPGKAPPLASDESGNPRPIPLAAHLIGQGVLIDSEDPRIAGWEARGFTVGGIELAVATARTRKGRATGPIPANLIALIIDDQLEQSAQSDESRVDPQCTHILADDTRCREGAVFYPGRSKKGVCREHQQ